MQNEHPFPHGRIARTLEANPIIIKNLIDGISDDEADYRPDPDRLTIREIIKHLAAWEPIFLGDMQRTCLEDVPFLDDRNEVDVPAGEILSEYDIFAERRAETVTFLRDRKKDDWARMAIRQTYGPTTLDAQAFLTMMHDTYHIRQIVEWRELYRKSANRV